MMLTLDGQSIPVKIMRSARAKRTSLRVDAVRGVVLVLPSRTPERDGLRFVQQHRDWIAERLAQHPANTILTAGATVPILGQPHVIIHDPAARRGVWTQDGQIHVSGLADHVGRRVMDYLKKQARLTLTHHAARCAAKLGRSLGRISVKDTRSRWGSCSAVGDLSFSWRLVLAPEWVLAYVVAHEAAHWREMNHSDRFWQVVGDLCPDHQMARAWLKTHGADLHRYRSGDQGT